MLPLTKYMSTDSYSGPETAVGVLIRVSCVVISPLDPFCVPELGQTL